MNKKRVAFVIESSHRPEMTLPAFEFYKGPHSNWIKSVISYMDERGFEKNDIYFLSFYKSRIIPYSKNLCPYPKRKEKPKKPDIEVFAKKISKFILENYEGCFVEIHTGKDIGIPLQKELKVAGVQCRIYANGVPLGQKPAYYRELIVEYKERQRLKEKKFVAVNHIQNHSVYEAKNIVEGFENKSMILGIEVEMEELKYLLKKHFQKQKDVFKARDEFELTLSKEEDTLEVEEFIEGRSMLSSLFEDPVRYSALKSKYGKILAKFTRYLIKEDYVKQTENKISEVMLRIKIKLLKSSEAA